MSNTLSLVLLAFVIINNLSAQPGALDPDFGIGGKVTTPIDLEAWGTSMALQPDGKIVVGGYYHYAFSSFSYKFAVVRYNVDGSLDNNFGFAGISKTEVHVLPAFAYSVNIQSDGKIILAGNSIGGDFITIRLNPNGTPDSSFSDDAVEDLPIGSCYSSILQPDEKLVEVGGQCDIARYNPTGMLDSTFGTNGIVLNPIDSSVAFSVKMQSDGKFVLAGNKWYNFLLARFNNDGGTDETFGINGKTITTINSGIPNTIHSIIIDDTGNIIAAASTYNSFSQDDFTLMRYTSNGVLDSSFNGTGIFTISLSGIDDEAYSVDLQVDGKIIAAGYAGDNFAILRFNEDGSLDSTFGIAGIVITDFNSSDDQGTALLIQGDGKIVVAGTSNGKFAVARYLSGLEVGTSYIKGTNSIFHFYPNPAISEITIEYTLTKRENLSVSLFDLQGKKVQSFISNENRNAGIHKEILKLSKSLPVGQYILSFSNNALQKSIEIYKEK